MMNVIAQLGDVAEGQWGSVTRSQASALAIPTETIETLIDARVVEPVIEGVIRLRAGGRHPFPRLFAEWLLLQPARYAWQRTLPDSGVVSHRAALRVYNLGDWPGPTFEFTVPPDSSMPASELALHADTLRSDEWQLVSGLPVTTPSRTIADIARGGSADSLDLSRLVVRAQRRGLTSTKSLSDALAACAPSGDGRQLLESLLASHEVDL